MNPGRLYHRSIEVTPSNNNGWIVRIGCHTLVYGPDPKLITSDMIEFFKDPSAFEKKFRKKHRSSDIGAESDDELAEEENCYYAPDTAEVPGPRGESLSR